MSETSGTKYLEDQILLKLLATAKGDDAVPWMIDYFYNRTLNNVLNKVNNKFQSTAFEDLSEDSFAIFWDDIVYSKIKWPLHGHLFYYYLEVLKRVALSIEGTEFDLTLNEVQEIIPQYLESEILADLLWIKERKIENCVYNEFKLPIINVLKSRYTNLKEEPEGIFDEALADGIKYIREDKLSLPLTARLLTLFARFAWYKLINWFERNKRSKEIYENDEKKFEIWMREKYADNPYNDYLEEKYKAVKRLAPENDKDLINKILANAKPPADKYLKLRFLEEYSYKEIVDILKKEGIETNENALRARIFSTLKKLRREFKPSDNG